MAYNLNLVQGTRPPNNFSAPMLLKNTSLSGFPSGAFNYLLFSEWVCLGNKPGAVVVNNIVTFFEVAINNNSIQVILKDGLTSLINKIYPATIQNFRSNILVSVDTQHQILQIYINDAPIVVPITDWIANGSFSIGQGLSNWDVGAAGSSGGPTPSLADVYINAPNAFYDLSVEANRRKFINADLTPVDLGTQGNGPTGSQPQIWLNANSGNPNDFATNFGFGGAFNQAFTPFVYQAANVCAIPISPNADVTLTGVSATGEVGAFPQFHELKLVSLYPILPSSGDAYGLISDFGADFPANFSQFSLSVWCCEDVNIRGPNSYTTPFSFDMKFTPTMATLQFYDSLNQALFSGNFANPNTPTNIYHVMFSIDTQAQTYALWIASGAAAIEWTTSDAHFATIGGINNVGA